MKRKVLVISMLVLMASSIMAQGNTPVVFRGAEVAAFQDREVVTFTTHNQHEANVWAENMEKNGYDVIVEYNPRTRLYTCTATR